MKRFSQLHTEARAEDLANNARARAPIACPPGYKFNKKTMRCEPITPKDDVSGNRSKDAHPENGPGYGVIGSHGMNGEPYAYEEPATDVSEARSMVGLPEKKTGRQPRDLEDALRMIGKTKNGNRGKLSPVNASGGGNHTRRESDYIASLLPINGVTENMVAGDGGFTSKASPEGPTAGYDPVVKTPKRKSKCPRCGSVKCRCLSNSTLQDSDY